MIKTILIFILTILSIYFFLKLYIKSKYRQLTILNINNSELDNIDYHKYDIIYIKNFLDKKTCKLITKNIREYKKNIWKFSKNVNSDVYTYGIPFSHVKCKINSKDEYYISIEQYKDLNNLVLSFIKNKIKNIHFVTKKRLPFIIREYNKNIKSHDIIHTDCDDNDNEVYSLNIYLKTNNNSKLSIWPVKINPNLLNYTHNFYINKFINYLIGNKSYNISPGIGDLIIFNTRYPHVVKKSKESRFSIQSFLKKSKFNNYISCI